MDRISLALHQLIGVLQVIPTGRLFRWLLVLVVLVNIRSWPMIWHYRFLYPFFRLAPSNILMRLRHIFKSHKRRIEATENWFDSVTPVGADPFEVCVRYNSWASLDDCDYNGHLSNSSYAKTMDFVRCKIAVAMFPQFLRAGGWIPLGGTHFNFIREIPMFSPYQVRISVGSWDQKWMYLLTKFVTRPKHARGESPPKTGDTRTISAGTSSKPASQIVQATTNGVPAFSASPAHTIEPDGAVVHAVVVSICCFKIGRITVPPPLILAQHGFADPSPTGEMPHSLANPPPHWHIAKSIMSLSHGGSPKKLRDFLKGGWKDVAEGERWWEVALRGATEENRAERLRLFQSLSMGMNQVKEFDCI